MANMSDPRVVYLLKHAERCRTALKEGKERPEFPHRRASMKGVDLSKADMSFATLSGVNFLYSDLSETNFTGCDLSRTFMYEANIKGANFAGADIEGMGLPRKNIDTAKGLILLGAKYMKISEGLKRPRLMVQAEDTGKLKIRATILLLDDK